MISSRITAALAAVFATLVITFLVSVHGASRLATLNADVTLARDLLGEIERARGTLREVESARRGYLLTHEDEFLELFLSLAKESVARLDRLRELTVDDPVQRRRVDAIGPLVERQLALMKDAIAAARDRGRDRGAVRPVAGDGAVVTQQILGLVAELRGAELARLREHEADAKRGVVKVIRGFAAVALVALLLLGGAYYALDRDAAAHAAVVEELRRYTGPLEAASRAAAAVEPSEDAPPDAEHAHPT